MKINRIKINNYHDIKDIDINLTYPAGHEKAGKPLDKVCFMGPHQFNLENVSVLVNEISRAVWNEYEPGNERFGVDFDAEFDYEEVESFLKILYFTACQGMHDDAGPNLSVVKRNYFSVSRLTPRSGEIKDNPILNELEINVNAGSRFGEIEKIYNETNKSMMLDCFNSGTKKLIKTVVALYQAKMLNGIVLIDKPETFIHPHMQLNLINHYIDMAENSQFFITTDSPFIMSNFEPWELVRFGYTVDRGYYIKRDYEGERHVGNYKDNPQYMRWDKILLRFMIGREGGPKRDKALDEFSDIDMEVEELKRHGEIKTEHGQRIVKEYLRLCDLLGWDARNKSHINKTLKGDLS